jgi:Arc/MetJ-type ribon-helix-helix transcriptional regulator
MAAEHSHRIAFAAPPMAFVDNPIADGRYASVIEVVRAALRPPIERESDRGRSGREAV